MRLRTARLDLESVDVSDAHTALSGQRNPTWANDYPTEGDLVVARLVADNPNVSVGTFVPFKVVLRGSRQVVGGCGYLGPPDSGGSVEIGYGLAPSARGNGLATEAVRALTEKAWQDQSVSMIFAITENDNPASQAVLLRVGFQPVHRSDERTRWEIVRPVQA